MPPTTGTDEKETIPVQITEMSALDLSRAIQSRAVSCVEVMRATLDAIAAKNPAANAIVSLRPEDTLLAEAAEADAALSRGEASGWMHGMPHAVKDTTPAAGLPFTQGSPAFADRIAEADAPHVARMRAAGAIFIGKTNVPEFGLGSHTYNAVFGATRNPYDPGRTAGGSSGGGAVALALRMLPLADGSDHAGSLRNPAAFNNLFGLRPGLGRVVDQLEEAFNARLTVSGPMARRVEDLAALLSTLAGPDPRAPLALDDDPALFRGPLARPMRGLRFGWLGDLDGHLATEPGVLEICEAAARVFEELGATVEPAGLDGSFEPVFQAWKTLRHWQAGAALAPVLEAHSDTMKPEAVWEVEEGLRLSAFDIAEASATRTAWFADTLRLFERFDYLLLPGGQVFPFPIDTDWPREIAGRRMDTYHRWMEVMIPVTMAGCPAISVPAGFGPQGLPMGLQIWAPWRGEFGLLQVAHAHEQATGWVEARRPPGT
jgi:amidase